MQFCDFWMHYTHIFLDILPHYLFYLFYCTFELLKYLKTKEEVLNDTPVIQRNIHVIQTLYSSECGRLSLYVLKCLSQNISFDKIIQSLKMRYDNIIKIQDTKIQRFFFSKMILQYK